MVDSSAFENLKVETRPDGLITTDLVYIRLHGHTQTYASSYTSPELAQWAERITHWLKQCKQVHVYFDNDAECAAPLNALKLKTLIQDE